MELVAASAGFLGLVLAWMILPAAPPRELRAAEPALQLCEDNAA